MLRKLLTPVALGLLTVSSVTAAKTDAEAKAAFNQYYKTVKAELPKLMKDYKAEGKFSWQDKIDRFRVVEKEFIVDPNSPQSITNADAYSSISHGVQLGLQFVRKEGGRTPNGWEVRARSKEVRFSDKPGVAVQETQRAISEMRMFATDRADKLRRQIEFLSDKTLYEGESITAMSAVQDYLGTIGKYCIDPQSSAGAPKELVWNVRQVLSKAYTKMDRVVRPSGQASTHKTWQKKSGNIYIVQVYKRNILDQRYLDKEYRYTVPPAHKKAYFHTDPKVVSGDFAFVKKTQKTINGFTANVYHYKTKAQYVKEYNIWQKNMAHITKLHKLMNGDEGATKATRLAYVDKVAKTMGVATLAQTSADGGATKELVAKEIAAAYAKMIEITKTEGAVQTHVEKKRAEYIARNAAKMKERGGAVPPPSGPSFNVRVTFRQPSGKSFSAKYFKGGKVRLHPEGKPEAIYFNKAMDYSNIFIYNFPQNQPQAFRVSGPDGTVFIDTVVTFNGREESIYMTIDDKVVLGDGGGEKMNCKIRLYQANGNSYSSTQVRGFSIGLAKKSNPGVEYKKQKINSYYTDFSDVFCSHQIVSVYDASGAKIHTEEIYMDMANKSRGYQEFKITVADKSSASSDNSASNTTANNSSEPTPQNNEEKKEPAKKKRGSKLKKLGKSLFN